MNTYKRFSSSRKNISALNHGNTSDPYIVIKRLARIIKKKKGRLTRREQRVLFFERSMDYGGLIDQEVLIRFIDTDGWG